MNPKSPTKSKTIWVNSLTLLVSLLTVFAGSDFVDAKVVAYITGLALPVANIVLRFITKEPLRF